MTNEFIVFIKDECEFLTIEEIRENSELDLIYDWENNKLTLVRFNSGDGYTPEEGEFSNPTWEKVDCEFFPYINKTDINGKKIYPDCSIFEFEHINTYRHKSIKQGFFTFDEDLCCYMIKCINEDLIFIYAYTSAFRTITNIKIIDTIQENKLSLLIKK